MNEYEVTVTVAVRATNADDARMAVEYVLDHSEAFGMNEPATDDEVEDAARSLGIAAVAHGYDVGTAVLA